MNSRKVKLILFFVLFFGMIFVVTGTADVNINELPEKETLRILMPQDPRTFDPHKTTSYADDHILTFAYDRLVELDYDLSTIKPALAESWDISEDGLTYSFKLKKNVMFHSGKGFTADDVKYSFERWIAEETASPSRNYIKELKTINVEDDYRITITLKKSSNVFLKNLTSPYASILNKEAVVAAEESGQSYGMTDCDGTGAFKFKEWKYQEYLLLERFEEYSWGSDVFTNKGPSPFKYVVFKPIPEVATGIMEFESGNIDIMVPETIPPNEVNRLKDSEKVTLIIYNQLYVDYLGVNLAHAIVSDVRVRRALSHAINKDEYVKVVLKGHAIPAIGPLAPQTFCFWEGLKEVAYEYDPKKANDLLEGAGWRMGSDGYRYKDGDKLHIKLYQTMNPEYVQGMPLIQAYAKRVGIDIEIIALKGGGYWSAVNANEHDIYAMGLSYIDPEGVLRFYFHSSQLPYPNRMAFSNARVDELLDLAITTMNVQKQIEAYEEVQKILNEEAVWIPLYHRLGWIGVSRNIKNYKVHAIMGHGVPVPLDYYK